MGYDIEEGQRCATAGDALGCTLLGRPKKEILVRHPYVSLNLGSWAGRFSVLAAVLVLPVVDFLLQNDYLLPRVEVVVVVGVALLLSTLMAGISRRVWLFDFCVILVLVVAHAPRFQHAVPIFELVRMRWPAFVLAAVFITLRYVLRDNFYRVLIVFQLAVFSTGVVEGLISPRKLRQRSFETSPAMESAGSAQRPRAVLYLILDSYMGLSGFPRDFESSALAAQSIRDTFLKYNFTIYENAYSNYSSTQNTLSSLLALDRLGPAPSEISPKTSALFGLLASDRYRLNAYHSEVFDLCGKPRHMNQCVEYPANSIGNLKSSKPGFPFWPWHGESIHPRCPEDHVFPR